MYACSGASNDTPTPVAEKITVSFDTQGGNTIPTQTITKGEKLTTKPSDPTKNNHTFNGWYTAATAGTKVNLDTQTFSTKTTLYARWTQTTITVSFDTQGGNTIPTQTITKGAKLTTKPSDPTKNNHTFNGWYTAATSGTIVNLDTQTFSAKTTLYARWTQTTFTITFDLNGEGATGKPDNQTVQKNNVATKPPSDPVRTDYNFVGWYQSQNPSQNESAFDFTSIITADMTLYARWTQNFIVTFDTQGGTLVDKQALPQGGTATRPTDDPTRDNYTFDNWYTTAETGGQVVTFPYTVKENITLYARWTRIQFTVTFNHNYGETPSTNAVMVNSGETASKPESDPNRDNYTFDNWYTTAETGDGVVTFPYTVTENVTLYARWNRIQFTITFNHNYGGTPSTDAVMVNSGGTASPLAPEPTREGDYTFLNWYESTSRTEVTLQATPFDFNAPITENKILYAKWTQGYVITFNTQGGSIISAQEILSTTNPKKAIKPTENPTRDCYTFDNWYENPTATQGETTFNFDTDITVPKKTLYARWTRTEYTLTFNPNYTEAPTPFGTRTTNDEGKVTPPDNLTTRATTHTFNGWYSQSSGGEKIVFTTQTFCSNTEVFAQWLFVSKQITFDLNYVGKPTPTFLPTNTQEGIVIGTPPSVPTERATTHTLEGWYTTAETTGEKIDLATKVFTAPTTLYARWGFVSQQITFDLNYTGKPTPIPIASNTENGKITNPTPTPSTERATTHTLEGWYTAAETAGEKINLATQVFTSPTTLYARWVFVSKQITLNLNYPNARVIPPIATNTETGKITYEENPVRSVHYTFSGWYTMATGGETVDLATQVFTATQTLYARWTQKQYTITFDHNYMGGATTKTIPGGELLTAIETPTRSAEYVLLGWFEGTSPTALSETDFNFEVPPTQSVTLYAKWAQGTVVSFDSQGGTNVEPVILTNGMTMANKPEPNPTKDRHAFLDWYENAEGTGEAFAFTTTITAHKTLYAKWKQTEFSVQFNTQGGSMVDTQTISLNRNAIKPNPNPNRENYIFKNWFENPQGTGKPYNFDTTIQADKTLYAIWSRILFAITFDKGYTPPTGTPQTTKEIINQQGKVYKIKPIRDKYTFKGWYTAQTGGEKIDLYTKQFEASTTLYAQWELYTIIFNDGYGETPTTVEKQINAGGKIVGKANPTARNLYTFSGWFTAKTGGEQVMLATHVFTAPTTLYAQWSRTISYTITFNDRYDTSPTTNVMTNNDGKVTKTNPATRDMYTFKGWYTAITGGEKRDLLTYVFTEDTALFAQWELVTITFNDGYDEPANVVTQKVNTDGKIVGKAAPTRTLYTFNGWFTVKNGGTQIMLETYVFTVPITLYAQWSRTQKQTITFNDGYSTSPTTNVMTNNDGRVTKTDPATRDRYTFKGWYTAANGGEKRNLLTYVFTEDTTLFAQWELATITFNDGYGNPATIVKEQINAEGKIVDKAAPTERNLYTFNGWFTAQTGGDQVTLTTKVFTAPTTLYAQWTRTKYVVTLNYNDGVPPLTKPANIEVNPNERLSAPTSPERTHYTLDSWHTSVSLSTNTVFDFGNTEITADMSLYAKWTRATYTVTFNYNDGKTPLTTSTLDSNQLGFVGKPSTPTHANSNFKFVNWYAKENPADTDTPFIFDTTLIVANMELYALWTNQNIIISFNTIDGSDVPSQSLTAGEAAIRPNLIPTKKHFAFVTWVTQEEDGEIYDFRTTISADKTIYARWRHRPETKTALLAEIRKAIAAKGNDVDLNYIDTSLITDMSKIFQGYSFNGNIAGWNVENVENMNQMFSYTSVFNGDISRWNVHNVKDMSDMFGGASAFNGDISNWNVHNVKNMGGMFGNATAFNQNISSWNVSKVTNMVVMFTKASAFNGDISRWNVQEVTNMQGMFNGASAFNGDISRWNVQEVTNMQGMFNSASAFNQDLSAWNIDKVTNMSYMFSNASAFTYSLEVWNVKNTVDKYNMFNGIFNYKLPTWIGTTYTVNYKYNDITVYTQKVGEDSRPTRLDTYFYPGYYNREWYTDKAKSQPVNFFTLYINEDTDLYGNFKKIIKPTTKQQLKQIVDADITSDGNNVDLNYIDTSAIDDMSELFSDKTSYSGNIELWNVSAVTNMSKMFINQSEFNGIIANWDVSNVTNMSEIFKNATKFGTDTRTFLSDPLPANISLWNVEKVTNMESMFEGATKFNDVINPWNVEKVTNMKNMFKGATDFGRFISFGSKSLPPAEVGDWNVETVTNMEGMFEDANAFNSDITAWRPIALTTMVNMFKGATAFNKNINAWNIPSAVAKTDAFLNSGLAASLPSWATP